MTCIPLDAIVVTDSYDLYEDDEEQGESGAVIIEHCEPVVPRAGGKAQTKQQTEQTHQACKVTKWSFISI